MVDTNKLRGKIVERGKTVEDIANAVGVHKSTFYRHMRKNSFTVHEVDTIVKVLSLSAQEAVTIFFAQFVA